ncbi:hypothetical protein AHAS_Ahas16G0256100 [Arachis hypogaea]
MEDLAPVIGNAKEKNRDICTQFEPGLGADLEGDNDHHIEEQRLSWEEEMVENKETWNLAVESGVQCSDEEDIMAILGLGGSGKVGMLRYFKSKFRLDMLELVETKKELVTNLDVSRIWGRDGACWEFVSSIGTYGGLLLIWDEGIFKLTNCYKGDRCLCVEGVVVKDNFNCAICLVYGPHERAKKASVWEELSYIAGLVQVPFCCLGDFNEILHLEERKGATRLSASAEDFRAWINDMELTQRLQIVLLRHSHVLWRGVINNLCC